MELQQLRRFDRCSAVGTVGPGARSGRRETPSGAHDGGQKAAGCAGRTMRFFVVELK
jgi:hypothetical protein